jgi:hypothetical protein
MDEAPEMMTSLAEEGLDVMSALADEGFHTMVDWDGNPENEELA